MTCLLMPSKQMRYEAEDLRRAGYTDFPLYGIETVSQLNEENGHPLK